MCSNFMEYKEIHRGIRTMTNLERRQRARNKRRRQVAKQRFALVIAAICVIILGSVVCGSIFSSAKDPQTDIPQYKYYKSVVIEDGDSLWSIANEYNPDKFNTQGYIDEIKELNSLESDTIHAGQHLLVIYYETELH